MPSKARWPPAVEEHEQNLTARDGAKFAALVRTHFRNKGEMAEESLLAKAAVASGTR